ncbi:MAG: hypothetical protein JW878_03190 [Methanomicrobia archaeon]|nr:hypothetical protein [Methanomicrobia archaeon]
MRVIPFKYLCKVTTPLSEYARTVLKILKRNQQYLNRHEGDIAHRIDEDMMNVRKITYVTKHIKENRGYDQE